MWVCMCEFMRREGTPNRPGEGDIDTPYRVAPPPHVCASHTRSSSKKGRVGPYKSYFDRKTYGLEVSNQPVALARRRQAPPTPMPAPTQIMRSSYLSFALGDPHGHFFVDFRLRTSRRPNMGASGVGPRALAGVPCPCVPGSVRRH